MRWRMASMVVGQLRPLGVDRRSRGSRPGSRPPLTFSAAEASISAESRSRWAGSVLGNSRPMSGRAAAPSRASVTAWSSTSRVAVADQLPVVRHVDAAQPQRPARLRAMAILTESDPQLARHATPGSTVGVIGQSARIIAEGFERDNAGAKPQAVGGSVARILIVTSLGGGAGTRQTGFEPGALVEDLRELHVTRRSIRHFRFDGRQSLEGRAEGDVQDRNSLSGHETGDQRTADGFDAVGRASAGEPLQQLIGRSLPSTRPQAVFCHQQSVNAKGAGPRQPIHDAVARKGASHGEQRQDGGRRPIGAAVGADASGWRPPTRRFRRR